LCFLILYLFWVMAHRNIVRII